jgi:hypothetical protein
LNGNQLHKSNFLLSLHAAMAATHDMTVLYTNVADADTATNSAGVAPRPSAPHHNVLIGVPETPTNAPSFAAVRPDDTNANASLFF